MLILLSTASLLQGISSVLASLPRVQVLYPGLHIIELGIPVSLPFTIWGTNGIMIWSCTCLTKGISTRQRVIIFGTLILLALSSVCGGILFFVQSKLLQPNDYPIIPNLTSVVNILLYFTNFFLYALSEVHPNLKSSGSQWCLWFTQVELGVNCGSIIALTSVAHIVLTFSNTSVSIIALHLSPHIYVAWCLQALKARAEHAKVDGLKNGPVIEPIRARTTPDDPLGSILVISNLAVISHI
ncbi:hypothetical protein GALMADRAFT_144021 [Galerina marginata CBS 339.88]|uniref:Uncharacterized protein n=1 Tax=Galerina marginata (strain CBS 339.88) TaxID=685588 RepID=A0A067SKA4_GALM3|nr:hypothetical protein GALMADRAFT_144021 [Galerina marginata CBS 339.88]